MQFGLVGSEMCIRDMSNDRIDIKTEFNIVLDDFKIKVPRLLFQNIAEDIDVKVESTFSKYKIQ